MEVTEWEPEQAVAFVVRDANMEAHARATFEAVGPDRTVITLVTDFPGLDESKVAFLTGLMERSVPRGVGDVASDTGIGLSPFCDAPSAPPPGRSRSNARTRAGRCYVGITVRRGTSCDPAGCVPMVGDPLEG